MALSELLDQSGRLRGRKFAILLLISAGEPADGQQYERRDCEIIDRQRDCVQTVHKASPQFRNQPHTCQNWKLPADRAQAA